MALVEDTAPAVHTIAAHVLDVELSDPVGPLQRTAPDGSTADEAWLLLRLDGEPVGWEVVSLPDGGLPAEELRRLLDERWGDVVRRRRAGGPGFGELHARHLAVAPRASVVLCTRERPEALAACLESLTAQDHPDFAVWVVDNAPVSTATADVVARFAGRLDVRYVVEPRPGLSRARNRALQEPLEGEVVAWIDDDEVADPMWLSELTRALTERPHAAAVSGLVVPAELATRAQVWFEQFGGHSKGRGFTPAEFGPGSGDRQSPLYPLPPFGVGANMAFRTAALRAVGGFDVALGAGTLTHGAEDTRVFTDLLRSGHRTLYHPGAVTRHHHRRDLAGLRRQMEGYGTGLTAFYTSLVVDSPLVLLRLAALAGRAVRDMTSSDSLRVSGLAADFPAELLSANRAGMLRGPGAYLRQRRLDRRAAALPAAGSPTGDDGWRPTRVVHRDLDGGGGPLLDDADAARYGAVLVVARRGARPVGLVPLPLPEALDRATLDAALQRLVEPSAADAPVTAGAALPSVSVVIPTMLERPAGLSRCLRALLDQELPPVEVLVVDNRPGTPDGTSDGDAAGSVPELDDPRVRLLRQPVPGISAARNRGVAEAVGDVVAFTDDDVEADRHWTRALAERFAAEPGVDGLGGLVLPSELETPAQELFEHHSGGAAKVLVAETFRVERPRAWSWHPARYRVLVQRRVDGALRTVRTHSLYQLGTFMGANMAFRAAALRAQGPFDEALGTGTPSRGGEDVDMVVRMLASGRVLGYEPTAITSHAHRRTDAELARQMAGYGTGFTALLTAVVARDPRHLIGLAHAVLTVVRGRLRPRDPGVTTLLEGLPAELRRLRLRGMVSGPRAYLTARSKETS
ncbi:glycosyl transferase family 2 [Geodermatophilus tzadiensis]|uniref:Glycosyl transferase family 2 n=1 Tax=Geodermatophilus tzadiensis TaxID=1137988 RepID=A0A2T0TRM4_9ACTN|nr:glycosyltransferase [Geodermatophilus tzadiensis]PRY48168.1 glycosyl transferase family 2 [Geodermatophilus tzadiensis]